jgi:hypothetical protein
MKLCIKIGEVKYWDLLEDIINEDLLNYLLVISNLVDEEVLIYKLDLLYILQECELDNMM